jgi:hypothetical protein
MAPAAGVAVVSLMPVWAAGQALFPRDAPKEPGANSWALELMKLPPFDPPRTTDGKPDLRGRWAGTPGGDDLEEHDYVDISSPPEESFVADPPDGKIPYQPWALARRNEHRAGLARGWPGETGRLYADPQTYCLYAVPRATYRGGFEIVQGPGYVLMMFNFGHYYRFIPTDGRPRSVADNVKLWMGNSRGVWEGNTLVVDVANLNARNWLDQVGNFFSDNVHLVERFTLADANTIDFQVTIDDPKVFIRPWTIRLPFRRAGGAASDPYVNEMWEHACHEGNKATEEVRGLGFQWFTGVVPPN